jgi:hypothetical protein
MGSSSNLPLAALCILLVAFYGALSALGLRFFRYLRQKNATQQPAEPRWTLAVVGESGGQRLTYKLDIDSRALDVKTKQLLPSLRSAIEDLVHSGVYLGYQDARRTIPPLESAVRDFEVSRVGARIELRPSADAGDAWALAPLKLGKRPGEPPELELDLAPVRHQIERIVELLLSGHRFLSEARREVEVLSVAVVDLEPGEVVSNEFVVMGTSKVCRALCCNRVASRNESKLFTSKAYTKGAVIQNFGPPLPREVMYSSTMAGSLVLFVTWAAFYPGLLFDRTAADCTMSTSSGFCTADRVMADVNAIQSMTKEVVRYEEAKAQAETTAAYATDMAIHVNNYTCTEEIVNDTALELSDLAGFHDVTLIRAAGLTYNLTQRVPFPDWCGNLRQEWIRAQRRQSCPDERCQTVTVQDECRYFDPSGLNIGATRYCLSEVADVWPITETVCIPYEGTCDGTFHDALDQHQASLTDYLEDKARRYSPYSESEYMAFGKQVKDSVTEMATRFAQDLKYRVDLASDLFIYYCILGLWFPTPFIVNCSPWTTGVKRNVFGVSKRTFVLFVIFVTFFLDILRELQNGVNLTLYFFNIAANPCFLDGDFLASRAAAIGQVCNRLQNYSQQVIEANNSVASFYTDIAAYGPAGLPDGCGCEYPGDRAAVDAFVADNQTGLREFVGDLAFCSNATAQRQVLNPPQVEVNWWTVWFKSGVVAELILKVTLVNLAHAIIGYTDPLSIVGGKYEVHQGSKPLSDASQEEIALLLSYQHARDACVWGFIAFIAIFNLLWSGVIAVSSDSTATVASAGTGPNGTGVATMQSSAGGCMEGQDTSYAVSLAAWFFSLSCIVAGATFGGVKMMDRLQEEVEEEQREKDKAERHKPREAATGIGKFKAAVRTQQAASAFDFVAPSLAPPDLRSLTPPRARQDPPAFSASPLDGGGGAAAQSQPAYSRERLPSPRLPTGARVSSRSSSESTASGPDDKVSDPVSDPDRDSRDELQENPMMLPMPAGDSSPTSPGARQPPALSELMGRNGAAGAGTPRRQRAGTAAMRSIQALAAPRRPPRLAAQPQPQPEPEPQPEPLGRGAVQRPPRPARSAPRASDSSAMPRRAPRASDPRSLPARPQRKPPPQLPSQDRP